MLKELLIEPLTPVWTINSSECNNFVQPPQSLSKSHRPGNFSNSLRSFHTLEREKTHENTGPSAIPTHGKSHPSTQMFVDILVEQWPAQYLPVAHQSLGRGSEECRDVSACHWHSFASKQRNCLHRKWTRGFIKRKAVCRTGWLLWLLSQDSRKELTSSITGHHSDTSEGKGSIRHMLCGQSKGGYLENQEQNSPHLYSVQYATQTPWIQRHGRATTW